MKSNVVYYILLLLDSENTVRIPGLGVLTRSIQSAKVLREQWSVKPPQATVDFKASGKNKGKMLARYISYKSGVDAGAADVHVGDFAASVKSSLRESGRVSIDYLGVFYHSENRIYFTPEEDTVNAAYLGLKTVELPVVIAHSEQGVDASESVTGSDWETTEVIPESGHEAHSKLTLEAVLADHAVGLTSDTEESAANGMQAEKVPVSTADTSKRRIRIPILLPIFLAIFLGVTALAIMQYNKRGAIYHPAATYNRAPVEDSPIFNDGEESTTELSIPSENYEEATGDDRKLTEVFSDNAKDMLGIEKESDKIEKEYPIDKSELMGETDLPDGSASPAERDLKEENYTVDNVMESDPIVHKPAPGASDKDDLTKQCYVIVGAFGVQANVDRMLVRLTKMGYAPASMPRNNLTQIGVAAPCGSVEVQLILKDLQQNVEAEAWIFKR
jgi:hypothetical protein